MSGFVSSLHPFVSFAYFAFAAVFSAVFMNPLCLFISFVCSVCYGAVLFGVKPVFKRLSFIIPLMLLTFLINPVFNHEGVTILFYMGNNPVTRESFLYGGGAALMMGSVIMWLLCAGEVFSSDKLVCLFGKLLPSLTLVITVTLRFIPAYVSRIKKVYSIKKAQTAEGRRSLMGKIKLSLEVVSSVTSWALEGGIDTADSMHFRGYGTGRRSSYSIFRFNRRDYLVCSAVFILAGGIIVTAACGNLKWQYFPTFSGCISFPSAAFYFLFFVLPSVLDLEEVRKWHTLKSKI